MLRHLIERGLKKAANELRKVAEFRFKMRSAGEKTRERALEKTAVELHKREPPTDGAPSAFLCYDPRDKALAEADRSEKTGPETY